MKTKLVLLSALALIFSSHSIASKVDRKTDIIVEVAGSIHVAKSSLDVEFKPYKSTVMKADMLWEVYWTLKNGLQIDYSCSNLDPKKDMCSNITICIEDTNKTAQLSTSTPQVTLERRSRFAKDSLVTTAYLDTNGLGDGEIKATGRLVLSAKI
ncbi:hypothetical protein [Photobacterium kagoshimensis]|uniref:hypothetical protein n=1 Tax=Photobacterium kagoshimensis TaxID=2910242 RepID=UPI003D0FA259